MFSVAFVNRNQSSCSLTERFVVFHRNLSNSTQNTIHGQWNGRVVPLVYMLLPRKTIAMYTACLENLVSVAYGQYGIKLVVQILSIDFERAAVQAFRNVFGENIQIQACHFHLCKSIMRSVARVGLQRLYRQNEDFAMKIRMIAALAYVPTKHVRRLFRLVSQEVGQRGVQLLEYFEKTYVQGSLIHNGLPGRPHRALAVFPPSLWNCYASFNNDMATTNNSAEAWHRRIENIIPVAHPPTLVEVPGET